MTDMPKFSLEEFANQTMSLRDLWGKLSFWQKPTSIREKALEGYGLCFVNCDDKETARTMFDATLMEYRMRERLLIQSGKVNLNP